MIKVIVESPLNAGKGTVAAEIATFLKSLGMLVRLVDVDGPLAERTREKRLASLKGCTVTVVTAQARRRAEGEPHDPVP